MFALLPASASKRPQSKKKLVPALAAHLVGELLGPTTLPKFKMIDTQWSKVKIFENFFPNEGHMNIFRNVQTGQFVWAGWESLLGTFRNIAIERSKMSLEKILETNVPYGDRLFHWFQDYSFFRHLPNSFENEVLHVMATDVNVEIRGIKGFTPLTLAVQNDAEEAIFILLARDAEINATDMSGKTALLHAVRNGNESICKILLRNNADANIRSRGVTPLTLAVERINTKMVKLILDESRHIEMKNLRKAIKYGKIVEARGGTSAGMRSARECTEIITEYKIHSQKRKRKRDKNDNQ